MNDTKGGKEYRGVSLREPINTLRDKIPELLSALDAIIGDSDQVTKVRRNASMKDLRTVLSTIQNQMDEVPSVPSIENTAQLFEKLNAYALPEDKPLIDAAEQLLHELSKLIDPQSYYRFIHKNNPTTPELQDETDKDTDDTSLTNSEQRIDDNPDINIKATSKAEETSTVSTLYNQSHFFKNQNDDFLSIQGNLKELKKVAREFFQQFKNDSRQYGQGNLGRDANAVYDPLHNKFRTIYSQMNQIKTKLQAANGPKKSELGAKLTLIESQLTKLNQDIKNKIYEIKLQKGEKNPKIKPTFRR